MASNKSQHAYCPFVALGVERRENRHSNFLADILNPNPPKPHGFGDAYLRSFLSYVLEKAGEAELLKQVNLSRAHIHRELMRTDLIIRFDADDMYLKKGLVLVIEVKVDASLSDKQLEKYEKAAEKKWKKTKKLFFFLTLNGRKAKDGRKGTEKKWSPVSLVEVADGFDSVLQKNRELTDV